MQGRSSNRDTPSRPRFLVYPPQVTPKVEPWVYSWVSDTPLLCERRIGEPDERPLYLLFVRNSHRAEALSVLAWCIAKGVGYVFVEGADVDPHAARLKVEGGQEGGVSD